MITNASHSRASHGDVFTDCVLQERMFKLAAARALAQEAAAFDCSKRLRRTSQGDEMRKAAAKVDVMLMMTHIFVSILQACIHASAVVSMAVTNRLCPHSL